jgi:choline-glycine betaine transporter
VALVLGAAVTAGIRRDPTAWVSMAVGATIGTLALAVIVAGGISALAWMLSDPG